MFRGTLYLLSKFKHNLTFKNISTIPHNSSTIPRNKILICKVQPYPQETFFRRALFEIGKYPTKKLCLLDLYLSPMTA